MPAKTRIVAALKRLQQIDAEVPPFQDEAVVEAALLFDLYRGALGFTNKTSERQQNRADLVLHLPHSHKVVIEVKRSTTFTTKLHREEAIKQAARYIRVLNQKYGAATNGVDWILFSIEHTTVQQLITFSIVDDRDLALKLLGEMTRSRTFALFSLLSVLINGLSQENYHNLMQLSIGHRVSRLRSKAIRSGITPTEAQVEMIRFLFGSSVAPRAIEPLLAPLSI